MASPRKNRSSKVKKASARNLVKKKASFPKGTGVTSSPAGRGNQGWAQLLLVGLVLSVAGLFSFSNFHILLPPEGLLSRLLVHPSLLIIGFGCLVYAYRNLPELNQPDEMPRWQAYPLFALLFGLCFFGRFYDPQEPSAHFWFDNQVVTGDIANIVDAHQHYLLFPFGQREAFFPYLSAALWEIFPQAGGVWLIRLSCTVIDLIAIWGIYLLGSTLQGRRLGLILMAFWSVSLPMTIWNYFGMGQNTAALAAILSLLFFFRLIQKPTVARFIYWGAALGFGGYCYVPFRPWPPSMITIVLLWLLFGSKEKLKGTAQWFLAAGLWMSWAFLFFFKNSYLPEKNALVLLLTGPLFSGLLAVLLLGAFIHILLKDREKEINRRLLGWATGVATTAVLMAPLYLHPSYAQHTTQSSVFVNDAGPLPLSGALKGISHNIYFFFSVMFGQPTEDVGYYPLPRRSYFEAFPELGMALGLAYFTARPSWKRAVVILMSLVGMTSLVFSNHPHTGRVESAVPPLLLLGAWGFIAFWDYFQRESRSKFLSMAVLISLLGLWGWDSQKNFLATRDWMTNMSSDNVIGHQIVKDWKQYRIIISTHYPDFATPSLTVLCDQKEAYVLNDPNPIYLEQGEKGKDIVFYMYGSARYDQALETRVRNEFPQAQWSVIESPNPDIHRFMLRAVISMDSLAETPGKLFYIQRVPHESWRRCFYWKDYGVGRGIVWWDERIGQLKAPFPPGTNEFMSARATSEISVPVDGDYIFSIKPTVDVIGLSIDGKKVITIKSPQGSSVEIKEKIYLKAGIHQVTYVTTFRRLTNFADILVTPPGNGKEWILGQPALDSHP